MDLIGLNLFMDVARARSFAAVARARGLEPSSVSRAIAALEAGLGARLFHRSTRSMALTDAGETLLARAPDLVREMTRLREDLGADRSDPVGSVRLTTSVAFGVRVLSPLLPRFRERFPRLRLELVLSDAMLDLAAQRIDLAIRLGPATLREVDALKLLATRYHVVASPKYLASEGSLTSPLNLADRACLLFDLPEFRTRWRFKDAQGNEETVQVHGALVASNALVLREAALNGLGPALLADWLIAEDLKGGALVDPFPDYRVTATSFDTAAWLLHPNVEYMPRRIQSVIAFLRETIGC